LDQAALTSHPDKVPDDQREAADAKFKSISRAYEILSNDDDRALYDQHGMAAFEKGSAGGSTHGDVDMEDLFAQMFGGMGGMPGMGGMGGMGGGFDGSPSQRRKAAKGKNETQQYEVTLEELYKGKTTKFASTKNVVCDHCKGSGGRSDKISPKPCNTCKGRGSTVQLRPVGPGLVTQQAVTCSTCHGRGSFYADKEKCKKCKGSRTVKQKKLLELYIHRGSRQGERIVLAGEADQNPDDASPGDIIFELSEADHSVFKRAGDDLHADLNITLSEALTGFNRVVLLHLDGRGIQINVKQPSGKVLRPDEVIKVQGEGMPVKRSDIKGDLYLSIKIEFPKDGWLKDQADVDRVRAVLPVPPEKKYKVGETPDVVDEVSFERVENLEGFGAGSGDPRAAAAQWEDDDDDDEGGGPQCAQQ
jgi:DnaJ family protein A protein 2